jgi:hypothetical protein
MTNYRSHLSVTIWIVLASLTLGGFITIPERTFSVTVFNSPIAFHFSASFLAGMIALAATWAGLEAALRTHPQKALLHHTFRFWGLPTTIVLTGAVLLPGIRANGVWLLVLGAMGIMLAISMAGEYHTINPVAPTYARARLLLNGLDYIVAAVAFILLYLSNSRSLISASLIGLVAGLLSLDLLRGSQVRWRLIFLYSVVIALMLAQLTAVLNYWPFASVRVALVLLVGFYLLIGLSQQSLRDELTQRRFLEYLAVTGVTVVVIFLFPG